MKLLEAEALDLGRLVLVAEQVRLIPRVAEVVAQMTDTVVEFVSP